MQFRCAQLHLHMRLHAAANTPEHCIPPFQPKLSLGLPAIRLRCDAAESSSWAVQVEKQRTVLSTNSGSARGWGFSHTLLASCCGVIGSAYGLLFLVWLGHAHARMLSKQSKTVDQTPDSSGQRASHNCATVNLHTFDSHLLR